tara:strand:+ start:4607 stop:7570 length:2964 start_codon:yes stop_codon:yes gene_type:complete
MVDRYVEMGFSPESAEVAVRRYGDDLHAGCHWLMMQDSVGRVPKRLKTTSGDSNQTYIGSKVRFLSSTWRVTEFDGAHALVKLSQKDFNSRWEHISDPRMDWLNVCHHPRQYAVPRASWFRRIGNVRASIKWADPERARPAYDTEKEKIQWLSFFINHCRPEVMGPKWSLWRCISALTRNFVHEPNRPRPKGLTTQEIHSFRVEGMTYFQALCDVYCVSYDEFCQAFYHQTNKTVLSLFPPESHDALEMRLNRQRNPVAYLKQMNKKWRLDCLPLILFHTKEVDVVHQHVEFEVIIHDMTFVQVNPYEAGIHRQLQRLFFELYPCSIPSDASLWSGHMTRGFLDTALSNSRKKCDRTPFCESSPLLASQLFPYQKRCLAWLVAQEKKDTNSTSSWGWTQHRLADGFSFHTSVFGHVSLTSPNKVIRGGLLAQEVGMGKTIEMLALICHHKAPGPTLVVVPTTMLCVWIEEATKRTPELAVVKFHGTRRTKDMNVLRQADIVVTTYSVVVNETKQHVPTIGSVRWGRIILDESHEMKTLGTQRLRAICHLYAPFRWCVSATPWPKDMASVSAMLSFLGVTPFNESLGWGSYSSAQLLLRHHHEYNPSLFMKLISDITWWQRKRHVRMNLPKVTSTDMVITMRQSELYTQLLKVIRVRIGLDKDSPYINVRTRIIHYTRWIRQFLSDGCLPVSYFGMPNTDSTAPSQRNSIESFMEGLGTTNYDQSLRDVIESWRNGHEECCICRDVMERPTVTPCNHMFCYECIQTAYQHDTSRKCPLCREPCVSALIELTEQQVQPTSLEDEVVYMNDPQGIPVKMPKIMYLAAKKAKTTMGTKCAALIELFSKSEEKFVVFTQFYSTWYRLIEALKANNIQYASIQGKMTPKRRSKEIETFQTSISTKVFVMTTKTASVGITLTAGSHVVFMEPCENVDIRKQAIGRVWRIGQTRPVRVTTLKIKNSIDMIRSKDHLSYIDQANDESRTLVAAAAV